MNIMFSILFLIFFSISVSSQTSCTPKYSLGQLHSDKINIYSFRTVRSNQQSSDYPYQFNVSTFSKPPAVIFSIHTFSIESFSSINYKLSANVINNKVLFIFRSVDMRWKYFEINFILTSRNDLHYNIQTIDNFQKSGNSINSIDITKLPYYTPNKNYIFVHFIVGIISTFAKSYKYEVTPFDIAPDKYTIKAFSLTKASITVQTVYFQSVETQFSYSFNKYSFVSSQKNQYRSLWTEFSPLRYYLIGFNMINFEKQMAAITTSLDTSNSVLQISNWKGLKESHMIYLAIGDKSAQICAPCNNYVAIDKCLDKCPANQYAYDLLDGGKTCRQCSSNQGQILNKQQNSCLCNNNQKYYQGNCYDSKINLVICKPDQILINNNCQNKIVKIQVLKCDAEGQYLNKQKNICMCLSGYQRFQGACLNYCPKKSYRNSGGICVCNPGYMLNGLRQCQSVCPQFSNFILQLGQCVCIQNYQMKGSRCLKCNDNQAYNQVQKKCVEKIVFNAISTINCEPNETVLNGLCVCDHRSIKLNDKCVKCQGSSVKIDNKCVACPQNCASCSSFNLCTQCKSGFYLNYEYSCEQICGDGRRFTLPCDDGNNINGDGCSAICQREDGFSCNGGNASTRDICQLIDQNKKKLSLSLAQNGPFYLSPGIMTLFIINPPIKRSNADLSKLFTVNIVEKKFKPSNVFVHQDDKDLSQIRVFLEYKSSLPNGIFSASFKISQNNQEDSLNIMYNTIANSITSAISFINNKQSILT